MHPLFKRGRLGLYLLSWIPVAVILVFLIRPGATLSWLETLIIALPLCLVYAFMCLSAWYVAKSGPIRQAVDATAPEVGREQEWDKLADIALRVPFIRLAARNAAATLLVSLLWVGLAWAWVSLLSKAPAFPHLDQRFEPHLGLFLGTGLVLYALAIARCYVILSLEATREAEARVLESNILARDAELKALKAQINPHFLFNSLNSISALTSIDPSRARDMCVLLGEFLRLTLGLGEKTVVRFSEELDLLQKYLAIEKIRFGERLKTQETIQEESKPCLLPPLLLQPLMENAIRHGIANLPEGGEVRLTVERQNGRLEILVENSWDPDAPPRRSSGMGLRNVKQRLEARYGKEAALRVMAEGDLFQVSLSIPLESEGRV
jgi:hypothetical protein